MTSASTAAPSMTTTITPPIVPRGLRRSIWIQTSAYHGRVRGGRGTATATAAPTEDVGRAARWLSISDARVQKRIREIDEEVEAHDHRRDDQVHRLDDRIVQLVERLEEEQADTRQSEDRLDDDRAADVERRLQADQADDRDHRVLQRV